MARRTRNDDDAELPAAKAPRRLLQPEMVARVIRMVLSRELRGQVIRREHLLQAVSGSRVGFDALLNLVQDELAEVYGMKLVAVDVEPAPQSKNRPKPKYIVVNILAPAARSVLGQLWHRRTGKITGHNRTFLDPRFLVPRHGRSGVVGSSHDLVFGGVAFAVIVLIVVGENHLLEQDLHARLQQWGIPRAENSVNSNLGMGVSGVVAELEKLGYIQKDTPQSYKLGDRSMAEFGPKSMFAAIGSIYGTAFGPQERERALVTVLRVWPGAAMPGAAMPGAAMQGAGMPPHMMSETGNDVDAAAEGESGGDSEPNGVAATGSGGMDA